MNLTIPKIIRNIIDILTILSTFDSPEISKISGKSDERNRILYIINKNKDNHPEYSDLYNNIIKEIEKK